MSTPDLLWLLLPVAAVAGWFAAKSNSAQSPDAFWDYTRNFHQDLNVLLSEKDSQTTALFDAVDGAGHETADTHIALGNLFRRRGEMDRAILLHESVINKQELAETVRAAARIELARDYDSAGLTDRSEKVFRELIASGQHREEAFQSLLQLHEREQDWRQAIAVALEHSQNTGVDNSNVIAHYHCELARQALLADDTASAQSLLGDAIAHSDSCARALIMQAKLALDDGDNDRALGLYEQVETLRPELMPEIIKHQFTALKRSGDTHRLIAFVKRIQAQRNAYSVIRSTREVIAQLHSVEAADRFFKDQILKRPSLKGLRDWAHDQLALSKPGERDKVQIICDLLDQVMEDKPAYRCHSCGFQGNVMHWRCPSCGQWDSVSTIIGVEGE